MVDTHRPVFEPARSLLAVEGDQVIGHAGIYSRPLTVPGAVVPAAFVTLVAVAPEHTRRGIASTLVKRQLKEVRTAGEAVAVLWASEGRIYQRFGYGLASRRMGMRIENREVSWAWPLHGDGRLRAGRPQDLRKEMAEVYEAVRPHRPGYAGRDERWWDFLLADRASRRHGNGALRAAVHEGPSGVDGYALFRVKPHWDDNGPRGEVTVEHTVAANAFAYQQLWSYLLQLDLTRSTSLRFGAIDEPLFDMVDEPRRLGARVSDALWLRVVDVPAALAARRFPGGDELVIQVTDDLIPQNAGTYRLSGARTQKPADITLDAAALGCLYLGGGSVAALASAGRLTELRQGAIAEADAAMRWHRAPAALEVF